MTTTITTGTGAAKLTITPDLMLGYESSRPARTVVSETLAGSTDAFLLTAGSRTGRMELLFTDETAALTCESLHSQRSVFYLTDPDRPSVAMYYVVQGDVARRLHEERALWLVSIGWKEVSG